ncbi:MAG: DUF4956 domain-containing protein [Draconibacterium sp.]|nr:DUF4956 domain-containing protein [Draconibacterium sp.]
MNLLLSIPETGLYIGGEAWHGFVMRLFANTISLFILIRYIYYPHNGQSKFLFIFFLTGLMIFLISSSLDNVTLNIGMAFGLFAIFSIIRFRTPSIELKEITYLFISIGLAVINGLVEFNIANWLGLIIVNIIVLGAASFMERYKPKSNVFKKSLVFSPTNFNEVSNEKLLITDIKDSTGIDVFKVEVVKINKSKNEITVWIYYKNAGNETTVLLDKVESSEPPDTNNNHWESNYSNNY